MTAIDKITVSFRTDKNKRDALDAISKATDRNRSYLLNQAVDNLLDVYQWQIKHIEEGLRQAQDGEFVEEGDWRATFNQHR